jgi:hypothetical protein
MKVRVSCIQMLEIAEMRIQQLLTLLQAHCTLPTLYIHSEQLV